MRSIFKYLSSIYTKFISVVAQFSNPVAPLFPITVFPSMAFDAFENLCTSGYKVMFTSRAVRLSFKTLASSNISWLAVQVQADAKNIAISNHLDIIVVSRLLAATNNSIPQMPLL
jgi:hypothetical protein